MHSNTPEIVPFTSPFRKPLLTQQQIEKLKMGTLRLLEEVGINFPSQKALEIFADHGAEIDMQKQRVRIPPDLVMKAMSSAPRSFLLAGRQERFDLILDGQSTYICTAGTGVHVIDAETRQKRRTDRVARAGPRGRHPTHSSSPDARTERPRWVPRQTPGRTR